MGKWPDVPVEHRTRLLVLLDNILIRFVSCSGGRAMQTRLIGVVLDRKLFPSPERHYVKASLFRSAFQVAT